MQLVLLTERARLARDGILDADEGEECIAESVPLIVLETEGEEESRLEAPDGMRRGEEIVTDLLRFDYGVVSTGHLHAGTCTTDELRARVVWRPPNENGVQLRCGRSAAIYAGVAPVTEQSGNSRWVHWRFKCNKFLRETFVEWAAQTIPHSFWAGAYYQHQRARGASRQGAVRSLAYKWIRILFRCWKTGTRYDESRYFKALQACRPVDPSCSLSLPLHHRLLDGPPQGAG